jgi:hypothetical protein
LQCWSATASSLSGGHGVSGKSGCALWWKRGAGQTAGVRASADHGRACNGGSSGVSPRLRWICSFLSTTPALLAERDSRLGVVLIAQYPLMWSMLISSVRTHLWASTPGICCTATLAKKNRFEQLSLSTFTQQGTLQVIAWGLGTNWKPMYLVVLLLLILSYVSNFHLALRYPWNQQGKVRYLRILEICRLFAVVFLAMVPTAGLIDPINYLPWLPFKNPVKYILAVNAVVRLICTI